MKPSPRWLMVLLAIMITGIMSGGAWFYRVQQQKIQSEEEINIQAIAQLKVNQIIAWRIEMLTDGYVIMERKLSTEQIPRWVHNPQAELAKSILDQFQSLQDYQNYTDVILVDPQGKYLLSLSGRNGQLQGEDSLGLSTAFLKRKPVISKLNRTPGDTAPHLAVIAPLFRGRGQEAGMIGALIMQIDPGKYLYPLVQSWPTYSRTAEALLCRREGDDVLFLSELRHRKDVALSLRIPISKVDFAAAMAVTGIKGIVHVKDYRGVQVTAMLLPVPDSPWFMVAKVDDSELFEAWRRDAFLIGFLIFGLVFATAALIAGIWQFKTKLYYVRSLQIEKERRESRIHLTNALLLAKLGHWEYDVARDEFTFSDELYAIFHTTAEKMGGYTMPSARYAELFVHPDDRWMIAEEVRKAIETTDPNYSRQIEHRIIFADGTAGHIAVRFQIIKDSQNRTIKTFGVNQDITQRKQAEQEKAERQHLLQTIMDNVGAGIVIKDARSKYLMVNKMMGEIAGMKAGDIVGKYPKDIYPPEIANKIRQDDSIVISSGKSLTLEENLLPDANDTFLTTKVPIFDPAGNVTGLCGVFVDITSRRRAEQLLEEEIVRRRILIKQSRDGIVVLRQNGGIYESNLSFSNMLGYTQEETKQLCVWDWEDQWTKKELLQIIKEVGPTGEHFETRWRRKDSSVIDVEISTNAADFSGQKLIFCVCRDITERKEVMRLLENQQRILDQTGWMARIGGWEHYLSTGEAVWTATLYDIIGIDPGKPIPGVKEHLDYYPPEDRKILREAYEQAIQDHVPFNLELRCNVRKNKTIWAHVYGEPVIEHGHCVKMRGTFQDISERKRAEEALRESEKRLFSVLEAIPAAVCLYAPDYTLKYANATFRRLFGEYEGKLYYQIFHGLNKPCESCKTFRVFETEQPESRQWLSESGSFYIIYDEPLRDADNNLLVLEMLVDISERKQAQEELLKSREELRELALYLENIREEERKNIAREIHDELGQTITALKIDIMLLAEDIPQSENSLREQISGILSLNDSILNTVRRISSSLRPELLDDLGLKTAIEWHFDGFKKRTGINCSLRLTHTELILDQQISIHIFRIFQESLTNIARHSGATEVRVSLTKNKGQLRLRIRDNGYGIPEERLSSSKSLGLVGMRERALSCGGELSISTGKDKGATVLLTVPIKE